MTALDPKAILMVNAAAGAMFDVGYRAGREDEMNDALPRHAAAILDVALVAARAATATDTPDDAARYAAIAQMAVGRAPATYVDDIDRIDVFVRGELNRDGLGRFVEALALRLDRLDGVER